MRNTTTHGQNIDKELLGKVMAEKHLLKMNGEEPEIRVATHVKTVYPFPIRSWEEEFQIMCNLPC